VNIIDNPFLKLYKPLINAPKELKVKVMKDIEYAKFLMELNCFKLNFEDILENTIQQRSN